MATNWRVWLVAGVFSAGFLAGFYFSANHLWQALLLDGWEVVGLGWFATYSRYRGGLTTAHERQSGWRKPIWLVAEVAVIMVYNLAWPIWAMFGEDNLS